MQLQNPTVQTRSAAVSRTRENYRRYVKNFESIAKPLQSLTEKNSSFDWSADVSHRIRASFSAIPTGQRVHPEQWWIRVGGAYAPP